jgi:hypothetical protein
MAAAGQTTERVYVKKLDLLQGPEGMFKPPLHREITLQEILTCELLRVHPRPNICLCHSVTVEEGKVDGLVFDRCNTTLYEIVHDAKGSFNIALCMQHVLDAIQHMHPLRLIYLTLGRKTYSSMSNASASLSVVSVECIPCHTSGLCM